MKAMMEALRDSLENFNNPIPVSGAANWAREVFKRCEKTRSKKITYLEVPASFDIEASSFYVGGNKAATMYVWAFGIYGRVIIGRTWEEFQQVCETISLEMQLSGEQRLVVYVHNMDYDFQFFRKWLEWDKVFSLDERKPVYAVSSLGLEFRCSYKLSGYSLETVGKNLKHIHVKKLAGDLDYSVPRHSKTPLTETELKYVMNDAKVVMAYIAECMLDEGTITKIPLTKTGYVRRFVRNRCFRGYERIKGRIPSLYPGIASITG